MRLIVVEDSIEIRGGLAVALQSQRDFDVVGTASREDEAIRLIGNLRPDVVLLDIVLSSGSGIQVLKTIRRRGCCSYVVVMTNLRNVAYRTICLRLGADDFWDKSLDAGDMLQSLRTIRHDLRIADSPSFDLDDGCNRPGLLMAVEGEHANVRFLSLNNKKFH